MLNKFLPSKKLVSNANHNEKQDNIIELKCTNSQCKKTTKLRINNEQVLCSDCGSQLHIKKKLSKNVVKSLAIATGIGYVVASGPEWVQTDKDIIKMYESMNACMRNARSYEQQRDICACAFAKTYEEYKNFDVKEAFRQNINECY